MSTTGPSSAEPTNAGPRTTVRRTVRDRLAARRWALEREAAPHVEERWAEQLVLELRLRGVAGAGIGAVLAEVDSHCAESGATAADAFGDPVAYARALELPTTADLSARDLARAVGPTTLQVLGMLLVVWASTGLRSGEAVDITSGHLVLVALFAAETALVVRAWDVVLTAVVHRPVLTWAVATTALALPVAVLLLLDDVLLSIPALATVSTGTALLVAGAVAAHLVRRADATADDPVVPPLPGRDRRPDRLGAAMSSSAVWLVPVWTVVLAAVVWTTG